MAKRQSKVKVAIAIDSGLLAQIDALVDGSTLTSRSQAISHFLHQSLGELMISHGVILLHHSHHKESLRLHGGKPLLLHQLEFFASHGIRRIYMVTQESPLLASLLSLAATVKGISFQVELVPAKGTADALAALRSHLAHVPFIAMSGDTLNLFDMSKMVLAHMRSGKLATMGLVNKEKLDGCGVVLLDGEMIIDLRHDPPLPASHIINAGIYVFRPEVFGLLSPEMVSLERELFVQLVRIRQLRGHFTHGTYLHFPELPKLE